MRKNSLQDRHKRHLQVIELRDLGLSIEGIAEVLGIHKDTVYWHVRREKSRQSRLGNEGGGGLTMRLHAGGNNIRNEETESFGIGGNQP